MLSLDQLDLEVDFALYGSIGCVDTASVQQMIATFSLPFFVTWNLLLQRSKISYAYTLEIFRTFKWVKPQLVLELEDSVKLFGCFQLACFLTEAPWH